MDETGTKRRIGSAHVISLIALFFAVSGGATAVALKGADTVTFGDLTDGAKRKLMVGPVLPGQVLRGVVGADSHAADNDASDFGVDVSLPRRALNGLSDDDVYVNVEGWQGAEGQTEPTTDDTNSGCTGTPENPVAPPGKVCIYVSGADHAFNLNGYSALFGTGASPFGFKLKWDASQEGDTFVDATWAYTAPSGG